MKGESKLKSWGNFCSSLFGEDVCNKMEFIVPNISVRYKDELCFKGLKVPYKDFTKVAINKDTSNIIPLFLYKGNLDDCHVVDFAPLYCVGIGEILLSYSKLDTNILSTFYGYLLNRDFNITEDDLTTYFHRLDFHGLTNPDNLSIAIAYSLRFGSSYFGQSFANRIIRSLFYYYLVSPKDFCKIFFDFMFFYHTFISAFIMDSDDVCFKKVNRDSATIVDADMGIFKNDKVFSKFTYKTPSGSLRSISNGRGLGINALNILILNLVKEFGISNIFELYNDDHIDYCLSDFCEYPSALMEVELINEPNSK